MEKNNKLHNKGYPVYNDLKLELKNLEIRFARLTEEKIEYETQIHGFNSNYMLHLGSLIEEILKLRVDIYGKKKRQQSGFSIEINLNQLFEDAQLNYEEFKKIFQQQLKDLPQSLDDSEKKQLKIVYRKASRLCHPDKLAEDAKAKGEEFFKALNEAYRHQDLKRMQDILIKLESKASPLVTAVNKQIDNRAILQEKIILLNELIAKLESEVKCLQQSEIYQRIQAIADMNGYFVELELELQAELKALKIKSRIN